MTTHVTVLRTRGPKLAKTWRADGTIADYDNAKSYTVRTLPVANLNDLYALLQRQAGQPRECIIRGAPAVADLPTGQVVERNLDTFADQPSRLFMLDVDNFEPALDSVLDDPEGAVAEFVADLPAPFREANYVWQLSGSCGHPSKAGKLRAHLWFWMAAPLSCSDAEAWAKKYVPGADCTVHRTVQVNYTSAPVLEDGQTDPLAGRRLGLHRRALRDLLIIPVSMPVPQGETRSVKRKERATAMVDPREKPGVIGALCRAFAPGDIVTLFPDQFEEGSKPERLTWAGGGGAKEGLRVTDNGTHLFNSHSTSPLDGAANLFDFVRAHVFGHLDSGIDPDVIEFDVTAAPSYKAAVAWALGLPEVQAEMGSDEAVAAVEKKADATAEKVLSEREERAQRMTNIQALIARAEALDTLEHDIARRVAKAKTFSAADREVIAAAMQAKTRGLVPGGRGMGIGVIRGWLQAAQAGDGPTFPHVTPEGTPRLTIENLEALIASQNLDIRYNVIKKDIEIQGLSRSFGRDNRGAAQLADLQSRMAAVGMPNSASAVTGIITAIAAEREYNPVLDWIDSKPWDGRSRVADLAATIVCPDGSIDADLKLLILRKWLVQAAAGIASETPLQLRGVLVFSGAQYKGKSRWLKTLVPAEYASEWVITGRQIDPHNKDSINAAVSHWLCELAELDGTFRKSDIAALKGWIANDEDVYRKPYAAKDSKLQRRTTLFASVNGDDILQDATGNTRFWVLPVASCDTAHQVDMQQVWAEVLQAWRGGEPHWLEQDQMLAVQEHTAAFEATDSVGELLATRHPWEAAGGALRPAGVELGVPMGEGPDAPVWQRWSATDIARRLGLNVATNGVATRVGQQLGRRKCKSGHDSKGYRWWEIPLPLSEAEGL